MKIEFTFEERDWPLDVDESVLALPVDERDEALINQVRQPFAPGQYLLDMNYFSFYLKNFYL